MQTSMMKDVLKKYNMAKPIFTIGVPSLDGNLELDDEILNNIFNTIKEDYWVFIHPTTGDDCVFNVYYEKDFNEVKYEELKQIIKNVTQHS